jgi:hypothetical protein
MAEIDQEALERACARLAEQHNEGLPSELQTYTPEAFKSYEIVPYDEWLIFSSPGGFTNQIFLVSDPMVYEMAGWESYDVAVPEARRLKAAGATSRPAYPTDPDEDDDDDEDDD